MTRADKIRSMTDEELRNFIFNYSIMSVCGFMEKGGAGVNDLQELGEYLSGEYDEENDKLLNGAPKEE